MSPEPWSFATRPARRPLGLGLDELHRLPELLAGLTGRTFPAMAWKHRMTEKPEWEDGLKEMLDPWVAGDLKAGWDGETSRSLPEETAR